MRGLTFSVVMACAWVAGCQSSPSAPRSACACRRAGGAEPTVAAVLAQADRYTSRPAAVLTAIDTALVICERNIEHADETGYRTAVARVGGDGAIRIYHNSTQGSLNDTHRPLDVGIQGNGFFRVKLLDAIGDGFAYTRCGNFFANSKGELVLGLGDGYRLDPGITLPPDTTDLTIGQSGVIEYKQPGSTDSKQAGQIEVVQFMNQEGLKLLGNALYVETEESGAAIESRPGEDGAGVTLQGFLEASNVSVERERLRIKYLHSWRAAVLEAAEANARARRAAGGL